MKYTITHIVVVLVMLLISVTNSEAIAIIDVLGGSVDANPPPPPTGVCASGTYDLINQGTVVTTQGAANNTAMKVSPFEDNNGGIGYTLASRDNMTIFEDVLVTWNLNQSPATINATAFLNTVVTTPDTYNALGGAFFDATKSAKFGFAGHQRTAPCDVTPCLHVRTFANVTTVVNISGTPGGTNGAGVSFSHAPDNGTELYILYRNDTGVTTVGRVTTSTYQLNGTVAFAGDVIRGISSDDTSVYVLGTISGALAISKINRSTLAKVETAISGGGTDTAGITHSNGFVYVGITQGGNGIVQKYRTSDMTLQGSVTLGAGVIVLRSGMNRDAVNNKLYAVTSGGGGGQWYRIHPDTMVTEQSIGVGFAIDDFGVGVDFIHQRLWQTSKSGGNFLQLTKISLCT